MIAQRLPSGGLTMAALVLVGIHPTRMPSGYIEGEPMYLAAPISGQLTPLSVQRGDRVRARRPPSLSLRANHEVTFTAPTAASKHRNDVV